MYKLSFFLLLIGLGLGFDKDKHPELPEFPEHTNDHFKVTPFPYHYCNYMGLLKGYIFVSCTIDNKGYFILYDNKLKEVKRVAIAGYALLTKNGDVYVYKNASSDGGSLMKYTYPDFKPSVIEEFPFNYARISKDEASFLDSELKRNPTFDKDTYVKNKISAHIKNFNNLKLDSYMVYSGALLLRYGQKEYWVEQKNFDEELQFKRDTFYCNDFSHYDHLYVPLTEPALIKFDEAKLGKEYRVRLSFKKDFFGLEYFNLIMDNDTTKFKFPSDYLNGHSLKEYAGFNKKQAILITERSHNMFFVEKVK